MPKPLRKQSKELVSALISYFERERDNGGPLLPLSAVREDGTISKSWQDNNVKSVRKTKVEGKRYIIVHAGNSDGFIEGAELIFSSSTKKECPLTKFQQGFSKLHLLTEDALNWLQQIKNI
ncbi:hypothetical protein MTP99_003736 [Tenebrio molitor]|nr:hypothetical protein MTP99_003736 [Tenebrio molitor]